MDGMDCDNCLQVAVGAGMVIGPADRGCFAVITAAVRLIGIGIRRLEVLCCPERPKSCETGAKVLVIASEQNSASTSAELRDVLNVSGGQCAGLVCANQPKLVIGSVSQLHKVGIVTVLILAAVTRDNIVENDAR